MVQNVRVDQQVYWTLDMGLFWLVSPMGFLRVLSLGPATLFPH